MRRIIHGPLVWIAGVALGAVAGAASSAASGAAANQPDGAHGTMAVLSRSEVPLEQAAGLPADAPTLHLTAVLIDGTGWNAADAVAGTAGAVAILAQCGMRAGRLTLIHVSVPDPFRDLSAQASRTLAAHFNPGLPTLYFVRNTRNRPAFDAEAFGAGNTVTRPELTHSVWITRQAADLPETIAHELFHVLANSGAHVEDRANLMHAQTAPGRRSLTGLQCAAMLDTVRENHLIRQ